MDTPTKLVRRPGDHYTEEEIERGLTAVAVARGNTRRAARSLEAAGFPVPRPTLQMWQRVHQDRYLEIQRRELPRLKATMAEQNEALAVQYVQAEHQGLQMLVERLHRATEYECSVKDCTYISKTYEGFKCPEHPDAAPDDHASVDARDLSQIVKNIGIPKGIAIDKSLVLRGEATSIVEHRTVDESVGGLKRLGLVVDSTATELPAQASSDFSD